LHSAVKNKAVSLITWCSYTYQQYITWSSSTEAIL